MAQKEIVYKNLKYHDMIDSLLRLSEEKPTHVLKVIDSIQKTVPPEDSPLFSVESEFIRANAYRYVSDFKNMFYHFDKTKKLALKHDYKVYVAYVHRYIGDEYMDTGQPKKAVENYDKAIAVHYELKDTLGAIDCSYVGLVEAKEGKYAESNRKILKELPILKQSADTYKYFLGQLSRNYLALNNIDSARYYINKVPFDIQNDLGSHKYYLFEMNALYHIDKGNIDSAKYYNNLIDEFRYEYKQHLPFYENARDIAKLEGNKELELRYQDSINRESLVLVEESRANTMEDKQSLLNADKAINEKSKLLNNSIYSFIIAFLALLIFTFFLIRFFIKKRKKQETIIAQMKNELRSSMEELTEIKQESVKDNLDQIAERIEKLARKHELTDRETDVLLQITKGLNNKEIAEELFVSVNTIKYHTRNLYEKLDIKKRTEIASKLMYEKQ